MELPTRTRHPIPGVNSHRTVAVVRNLTIAFLFYEVPEMVSVTPIRLLFVLMFVFLASSCSLMMTPSTPLISDARTEIALADQAQANLLASREADEARMLLSQAEGALSEGDSKRAEQLAQRAVLMARYARILATYKSLKKQVETEELELETLQRELEAAKKKKEDAEAELAALMGGQK